MKMRLAVAAIALVALGARAHAEEGRVINEQIVVQDPTVADKNAWVVGGSIEGWYVTGPYNFYDDKGNKVSNGNINGTMPGGSGWVGYGPVTVQYSHREGHFKINESYLSGASDTTGQQQVENEITARWLFKVSRHFNPYAMAGYNGTTVYENDVLAKGFVWGYNGNTVANTSTQYNSFLLGGGAIVPFNRYVGARADLRLLITGSTFRRDDGLKLTGSGAGVAITGTIYGNIYKGLNAQAGLKYQGIYGGTNIPSFVRFGIWGSLGYSYKFGA